MEHAGMQLQYCFTLNVLYTKIANTPLHQECIWKRKAKPNEKSCPLEELRIAKAGYRKNTKQAIKLTTFDPTSLELDNESFMDSPRAGLEEHVPSAVVKQNLKILCQIIIVSSGRRKLLLWK